MNERFCIENGDCLEVLRQMPDACVDAVVTDPPSGTGFMGRTWDRMRREGMTELQAFQEFIREVFVEVYRVLKPGGHAVVWALPRTSHHTAMGLERAGFDIRDNGTYLFHVFGSGFPKSLDVSKAIDKAAGAERERIKGSRSGGMASFNKGNAEHGYRDSAYYEEGNELLSNEPVTDAAKAWTGFGTSLKPAYEAWLFCTKPLPLEAECLTLLLDVTTDVFSEALWQKSSASVSAAEAGLRCFLPNYAKAAGSIAHGFVRTPVSVSIELARLAGRTFTRSDLASSEANQRIAAESAATLLAADRALTTATGMADASFAAMAMSASESAGDATPWSIALSWSSILVDIFALTRTCIIETKIDPTTALKTLKSALALVTSASIIQTNATPTSGDTSLVIAVDALLRSAQTSLLSLVTTTAPALATTHMPQQTKVENGTQILVQGKPTVLSPDAEFWIVARKPLDGTVAENVLAHGTGALNIDGCRIETTDELSTHANGKGNTGDNGIYGHFDKVTPGQTAGQALGRWPAHLILDEGAAALLDEQSGVSKSAGGRIGNKKGIGANGIYGKYASDAVAGDPGYGDVGGASRFFYVPKANKRDKDEGLDDLPERTAGEKTDREDGSAGITAYSGSRGVSRNSHPTVKSTALMAWLVRLVTPPGGVVLDPFMGSGSTGKAALLEGFRFIGIERESEYFAIAERRLLHACAKADTHD